MSANFAVIFLVKNDILTLKKEVVTSERCFLGIAFVHVNFFCEYCGMECAFLTPKIGVQKTIPIVVKIISNLKKIISNIF